MPNAFSGEPIEMTLPVADLYRTPGRRPEVPGEDTMLNLIDELSRRHAEERRTNARIYLDSMRIEYLRNLSQAIRDNQIHWNVYSNGQVR